MLNIPINNYGTVIDTIVKKKKSVFIFAQGNTTELLSFFVVLSEINPLFLIVYGNEVLPQEPYSICSNVAS